MNRRGFTLIELLVVIAIIGLLMSLLVPSLSRARGNAKTAVCASNMRGLMQAVYLYANDNKDRLVSAGLAHGGSGNEHAAWINTLKDHYGGDSLIARCPTDQSRHWEVPIVPPVVAGADQDEHDHDEDGTEPAEPIYRRTSYGTNYYTVARIGQRGPYNKIGLIRRPSTTIHMVELAEIGPFATSDHVHPETWWSNARKLASQELQLERHLKRANYSYFDGHVGTHAFEETFSIDNQRSTFRKIIWNRNYYDPDIAR